MNTSLVKLLTASLHLAGRGRDEDSRDWSPEVSSDPVLDIIRAYLTYLK